MCASGWNGQHSQHGNVKNDSGGSHKSLATTLKSRRGVDPDHPAGAPAVGAVVMRQVGAEEEAAALRDRVGLAADDQLQLALQHVARLLAVMLERPAQLAVGGEADHEALEQP